MATEELTHMKPKLKSFVMEFKTEDTINAGELSELLFILSKLYPLVCDKWGETVGGNEFVDFEFPEGIPGLDLSQISDVDVMRTVWAIQERFISFIVSDPPTRYTHFSVSIIKEFLANLGYFDPPNTANELSISNLSFQSPLRIGVFGYLAGLVVLTFIGGGEFSVSEDGIRVQMPGIAPTINSIYETIFPKDDETFEERLKITMEERAKTDANHISRARRSQ